jgi:hypothetical protein
MNVCGIFTAKVESRVCPFKKPLKNVTIQNSTVGHLKHSFFGPQPKNEGTTCVFRLLSTKLQPPGGTIVTAPTGLLSRVCGQSLRPSLAPNHFWLPTTYLLLR